MLQFQKPCDTSNVVAKKGGSMRKNVHLCFLFALSAFTSMNTSASIASAGGPIGPGVPAKVLGAWRIRRIEVDKERLPVQFKEGHSFVVMITPRTYTRILIRDKDNTIVSVLGASIVFTDGESIGCKTDRGYGETEHSMAGQVSVLHCQFERDVLVTTTTFVKGDLPPVRDELVRVGDAAPSNASRWTVVSARRDIPRAKPLGYVETYLPIDPEIRTEKIYADGHYLLTVGDQSGRLSVACFGKVIPGPSGSQIETLKDRSEGIEVFSSGSSVRFRVVPDREYRRIITPLVEGDIEAIWIVDSPVTQGGAIK